MNGKGFSRLSFLLGLLALVMAVAAFDELRSKPQTDAALAATPVPPPARGTRTTRAAVSAPRASPDRPAAVLPPDGREPEPPAGPLPPPFTDPAAIPPPPQPAPRPATYSYDWHEGAAGMERALKQAKEEDRALAVYFYTDWCGYCRQLERELLERAEVEGYMKYLAKIRINPERGATEAAIANHYGVRGFPAFFVHRGVGEAPTKISRTVRDGGDWRLKTPEEFVESMKRALGEG